jgi:hypothetical protein
MGPGHSLQLPRRTHLQPRNHQLLQKQLINHARWKPRLQHPPPRRSRRAQTTRTVLPAVLRNQLTAQKTQKRTIGCKKEPQDHRHTHQVIVVGKNCQK